MFDMHVSIEELYCIVGLSGCAECVVIGHNMSMWQMIYVCS